MIRAQPHFALFGGGKYYFNISLLPTSRQLILI